MTDEVYSTAAASSADGAGMLHVHEPTKSTLSKSARKELWRITKKIWWLQILPMIASLWMFGYVVMTYFTWTFGYNFLDINAILVWIPMSNGAFGAAMICYSIWLSVRGIRLKNGSHLFAPEQYFSNIAFWVVYGVGGLLAAGVAFTLRFRLTDAERSEYDTFPSPPTTTWLQTSARINTMNEILVVTGMIMIFVFLPAMIVQHFHPHITDEAKTYLEKKAASKS